jgi:hypothetical protein
MAIWMPPSISWRRSRLPLDPGCVPNSVLAIVEALRFNGKTTERLLNIRDAEWPALLKWCDDRQVTLLLHALCADELPEAIRQRIAGARDRYAERFARLESELAEIVDALDRNHIEFVLLKGITHAPAFTPDPQLRAQGDIDLWFADDAIPQARKALAGLGYASRRHGTRDDSRHLPPMARPSDWKWRGDMFDPEMPIHVEAHYQLWSDDTEHIAIPGQTEFWDRRTPRNFGDRTISVLCSQDLLGFAALHFLLHLLHGDLPLERAWEIAHFLHHNAGDNEFWNRWRHLHSPAFRKLEALAFAIVQIWFRCDVHECVPKETYALAGDVRLWLDHFALSPLKQRSNPNKDELWLHLALIPSATGRARVLFRRLFPFVLARKGGLSRSRLAHHGRTLTPTVLGGLHWLRLKRQVNRVPLPAPSQ